MRNFKALAIVLPVFLGACGATTQSAIRPVSNTAPAQVAVTVPEVSRSQSAEAETDKKEPQVARLSERPALLPKVIEKKEPPVVPLPPVGVLRGKTVAEIEAVFGRPVLLRKDEPAEVWQYLTTQCALHIVFYPENKNSDVLRVKFFSMNDRNVAKDVEGQACFRSQLDRVGIDRVRSLG